MQHTALAIWAIAGALVLSLRELDRLVYFASAQPTVCLFADDSRSDLVSDVSLYSAWVVAHESPHAWLLNG